MDLFQAFEMMSDFLQTFTPNMFYFLRNFFDPDVGGVLQYWPFFLLAALFILFCIVRGIINLINDL